MSSPTGAGPARVDARRGVRTVLLWVLAANVVVAAAKIVVGLRSGAISVVGAAADTAMDALTNVIGLFVIGFAAAPPDEEHPYGHAKFETLGALVVVSFLSITCFEIVRRSVERLMGHAAAPRLEPATFYVLAVSVVVNAAVAVTEARQGRRLGSELLEADARHTAADVLVTLSVLGGLWLISRGWVEADAWVALLVAVVIAYGGYGILRSTIPVLVDRRAFDPERIRRFVLETPGVLGVSEVRSRGRPGEAFAELTVHVDPAIDVREAHRIADAVEHRLQEEGFAGVVAHVEPSDRE